jgi:hypothetical protein
MDGWTAFRDALDDSENLVYLATPEAAQSDYVRKELRYWLERRGPLHFNILLVAGDDRISIPDFVHEAVADKQVFFIDLRDIPPERWNLKWDRFLQEMERLACSVHGLERDAFVAWRSRPTRILVATVAAMLIVFLGLGGAALAFGRKALAEARAKEEALQSQKQALDQRLAMLNSSIQTQDTLLMELSPDLIEIGRSDVAERLLDIQDEYFASISGAGSLRDKVDSSRRELRANIAFSRGEQASAIEYQKECIAIRRRLVSEHSENAAFWKYGLSRAISQMADFELRRAEFEAAMTHYNEAFEMLNEADPKKSERWSMQSRLHIRARQTHLAIEQNKMDLAATLVQEAYDFAERLDRDNAREVQQGLRALVFLNQSEIRLPASQEGDLKIEKHMASTASVIDKQSKIREQDYDLLLIRAHHLENAANFLLSRGRASDAESKITQSIEQFEKLVAHDGSNYNHKRELGVVLATRGQVFRKLDRLNDAKDDFVRCVEIGNEIVARDESSPLWLKDLSIWQWGLGLVVDGLRNHDPDAIRLMIASFASGRRSLSLERNPQFAHDLTRSALWCLEMQRNSAAFRSAESEYFRAIGELIEEFSGEWSLEERSAFRAKLELLKSSR